MQSLSPTAYSDAFAYDSPTRVQRKLGGRIQHARRLNDKLAQYFAERAEAEEAFANSLNAAIRRLRGGDGSGGLTSTPGSQSAAAIERAIENEGSELVALHERFARRCRDQLEGPLKARHGKQDWTLLTGLERNSESLVSQIADSSRTKSGATGSTLLSGKNRRQNNTSDGSVNPEDSARAHAEWRENAPALLAQYQKVDYGRLSTIKEILTTFETLQNDLGRERMELAERGLAAILGWEVEQELTEYVSQEGFRGDSANGAGSTPGIAVQSPSHNDFGAMSAANNESARPPSGNRLRTDTYNNESQSLSGADVGRAPSIISSRADANDADEPTSGKGKKKGLFSAFKKGGGGSKMDRRKSTSQNNVPTMSSMRQAPPPPPPATRAYSNGRDDDTSTAGQESRERQSSMRSGNAAEDDFGQGDMLRPTSGGGKKSNRDSIMPSFSSFGLKRKNTTTSASGVARGDRGAVTPEALPPSQQPSFGRTTSEDIPEMPTPAAGRPTANPFAASMRGESNGVGRDAIEQVDMFGTASDDPRTSNILTPSQPSTSNANRQVDEEGFALPPANYNRPLGAGEANLMDMPDSDDENEQPHAMKVNIQPAASVVSKENDADREAAMLRMKNTLAAGLAPSPSSSVNRRGTRAARSRQSTLGPATSASDTSTATTPLASPSAGVSGDDVPIAQIIENNRQQRQPPPIPQHRNTQHSPSPALGMASVATTAPVVAPARTSSPMEMLASPTASVSNIPLSRRPGGPERAGSILSTSSSQQNLSVLGQGKSPFANAGASGFRASIVETVNVMLQAGQVLRVMVTGEIGLSLKDVRLEEGSRLRINGLRSLDRSAPNNAILTSSGSGGEYTINSAALHAAADRAGLVTVFKYSLQFEGSDLRAYVPIDVNPQWKIESNQTSFLMTYAGNPSCRFGAPEESPFGVEEGASTTSSTTLRDLQFSVPIPASGCRDLQTKPVGTWSEERKQIRWQMDELDLSSARTAKVLARFQTDTEGSPQPVHVHWKLPGRLASNVGIEIEGLGLDEIARHTQSGKYIAQP